MDIILNRCLLFCMKLQLTTKYCSDNKDNLNFLQCTYVYRYVKNL